MNCISTITMKLLHILYLVFIFSFAFFCPLSQAQIRVQLIIDTNGIDTTQLRGTLGIFPQTYNYKCNKNPIPYKVIPIIDTQIIELPYSNDIYKECLIVYTPKVSGKVRHNKVIYEYTDHINHTPIQLNSYFFHQSPNYIQKLKEGDSLTFHSVFGEDMLDDNFRSAEKNILHIVRQKDSYTAYYHVPYTTPPPALPDGNPIPNPTYSISLNKTHLAAIQEFEQKIADQVCYYDIPQNLYHTHIISNQKTIYLKSKNALVANLWRLLCLVPNTKVITHE